MYFLKITSRCIQAASHQSFPRVETEFVFIEIPIPTVAPPGDFSAEVYNTNFLSTDFFLNSFSLWTEIISHTIWYDNHLPGTWRSRILHTSGLLLAIQQEAPSECSSSVLAALTALGLQLSLQSLLILGFTDPSITELIETPISWWSGQIKFVVNCLFLKLRRKMEIQLKLK